MNTKSMLGFAFPAILAVSIGLLGSSAYAYAEGWEISNGLHADSFFGKTQANEQTAVITTTSIKTGTTVNLALSEFNGFAATNYFGTGISQVLGSSDGNEFRAFAVQMSASPITSDSTAIKSGTAVDLSLSKFDGFHADNFFGTGQN